jgi:hypothetical protein
MPYFIVVLPMLAFIGVVGAMVSLARGRRRSAVAFGLVGVGAVILAIALSAGGAAQAGSSLWSVAYERGNDADLCQPAAW